MISAVVPPRPIAQPQLPPAAPPAAPPSVKERAAAGYFRDLALWLNEPLVNQGIFVQVQADDRPGCLKLTVEFERAPIQDRLTRFLCHRVWQLNSELIEGIYILARPVGWQRVLWKQRIKISTPALRRRQANDQIAQAVPRSKAPLPPSLRTPRRRSATASKANSQRFKTLRTMMLTGSAVAAFVFGCLLEVILSGPSPSLPSFSAQVHEDRSSVGAESLDLPGGAWDAATAETTPALRPSTEATPGQAVGQTVVDPVGRSSTTTAAPAEFPRPPRAQGSSSRPSVVDTALEPVAVIPHTKPSPLPLDQVMLLFGGDISLENLNFAEIEENGGFFADVEAYFKADVSLVNLATPLATAATTLEEGFRQQLRPEAARMLANSGVDIVNLTHSSLMQYGAEGLAETLTALDSNGLYRVGAGRNATEARRPEILDVKGKRIAYLSYAMGGNNAAMDTNALRERAGANETTNEAVVRELENFKRSTAFQERAGFNAQNMPEIVQDIQAIRDQVDWIVVNFRWVDHLEETPNFVQTNLARLAIDQGADVVVGYHPTVIQGGEIYKGRPIAYSLGDFVFKPDQPLRDQDSAVLKVSLQEDQMQVEFVPVRIRDSRPQTLSGQEGQAVLQRIQEASAQFETPLQSSVVLDLTAPAMPSPADLDPSSPFVTPDAEDILILDPAPVETEVTEPDNGDGTEQIQADDASSPATEDTPSDTLELPLPEGESGLDLNQMDQTLPEWGPKVSPREQEFKPVPQNRSGAEDDTLAAQTQPDLLRRLVESLRPSGPAAEAWNDTVPAVPTAPMEVAPTSLSPDPAVAPMVDQVAPSAPPRSPAPQLAVDVSPSPADVPVAEEPGVNEMLEALPEGEEPETPSAAAEEKEGRSEAAPVGQEPDQGKETIPAAAFPETKVIPPQAEPLVGPLGAADSPDAVAGVAGARGAEVALAPEPAPTATPTPGVPSPEVISSAEDQF
ncbi:hypothetical protein GFS31_17580 [Leptolyngbya sp. BL0902]|uniref:CapA family protein n=1 Tax=Leptolyngbya sp. BL0902 TaxID=1115757 RepID=UPI0018E75E53|nr:CapA family protein [Leptolyngbya sp. BL0902]QQE65073.1 hypothetical protein GFS31_17580 [Leptolyngbya sp. BL0902]